MLKKIRIGRKKSYYVYGINAGKELLMYGIKISPDGKRMQC